MALWLLVSSWPGSAGAADAAGVASDKVWSFAKDKWDPAKWTPLRLPHQTALRTFLQRDESIGVDTFTKEDRSKRLDNVLLMTDAGTAEGEFEVSFSLSNEPGAAPGVFLSPRVTNGVLDTSLVVFVASYTMAVWKTQTDPATGETKYTHLARVIRWNEPNQKHVLRCRYSGKRNAAVIRLDQSDPLLFQDLGIAFNSLVGVWGCHGRCDFYSLTFFPKPVLEWAASDPRGSSRKD